jgi:hypothetical protein
VSVGLSSHFGLRQIACNILGTVRFVVLILSRSLALRATMTRCCCCLPLFFHSVLCSSDS